MRRTVCGTAIATLALTLASPAVAGVADSPLPELLAGQTTYHLYSVPGVVANGPLGAYFSCTSTDTAPMQVGVEVFGAPGGGPFNDPVATSLNVAPGATVTFGMPSFPAGFVIDSLIAGQLSKGSARILATSKKLACTAFVADTSNSPPTTSWQLTIIAKTKQKAFN